MATKNLLLGRLADSVGRYTPFLKLASSNPDCVEKRAGGSTTPNSLAAATDNSLENTPGYPYLVVRIFAAVYQPEEIKILIGPPAVDIDTRRCVVQHPAPLLADGTMNPACHGLLIEGVQAAVRRLRLRICIVWAPSVCTYVENDSIRDHSEPPSGGIQDVHLQFAPQHYRPKAT